MKQNTPFETRDYTPMRTTFGLLYGSVVLILVALSISGIWFFRHIHGLSDAINLVGSERMRAYQIAFYLAKSFDEPSPEREVTLGHVSMRIDQFEEVLDALKDGSGKYSLSNVTDAEMDFVLQGLVRKWEEGLKPHFNAVIIARSGDWARYHLGKDQEQLLHDFVKNDIDRLVSMLAAKMNRAERLFSGTQYGLTVLGIILVLVNLLYVRQKILTPLRTILEDTEKVANGNYTVISQVNTRNELWLFADRFNAIAQVIANMDETVRQRTSELLLGNARMQAFFDSAPDAILSITPDDKTITLFSKGAERLFGYSADEVLGKNVKMLMPEPYHSHHDTYVESYASTGIKKIIGTIREVKAKKKNGEIFAVDLSVSECKTHKERIFNAIIRDVSFRAKAENEMKKLSSAIEQSVESVVITDRRGNIEYVNPTFERVTGYSAAEVLGKNPRVLKSGRQSHKSYEEMWESILRGEIWRGEFINKKKNGELFYETATITPIKDEQGRITHFVAMKNDTSAQKAVEMELERKNKDLKNRLLYDRAYAEISTFFTSTLDRRELFTKTLALLATNLPFPCSALYEYDEWQGKLILLAGQGLPPEHPHEYAIGEGMIGQAVADGRVVIISDSEALPLAIETGLGTIRPVAVVVQPILHQGKIIGCLVLAATETLGPIGTDFLARLADQLGIVCQNLKQYSDLKDLSDQLRARGQEISTKNMELQDANRMKSEFLANISHELRTPLNAIIGFSEILKDEVLGALTDDQKEYVNDIFTSGEHLLSLINDILDLSKIEAGKMSLDLEDTHIPTMLENSLSIIKEKAMNHNIALSLEIDDAVGTCQVDPRKFKQIVYNLLANAVKFTGEGGTVTIRACHEEGAQTDELCISVTDTGIGMSEEGTQKLFRPFEQLDGSTSRKYEGTGLGLAMVKRLVELHGGTISVTSQEGVGSCFTIRLPLRTPVVGPEEISAQEGLSPADRGEGSSSCEKPFVLIIEDDPNAAGLLKVQLESRGYRTVIAADAEKGLKLARSLRPDLITLDIMLPGMNGWEFLERIKQEPVLADIPVVIVSITGDAKTGISLGARKVLAKPVKRDDLLNALREIGFSSKDRTEKCRILVVNDDPKAVDLVAIYLEKNDYTVLRAYGGQEAIDLAIAEVPDLLVLDLMMPEVSGFDVVKALRGIEKTALIPIVILTAKILTEEDYQALQTDLLQVVNKSGFSSDDFLGEIRRALVGHRQVPSGVSVPASGPFSALPPATTPSPGDGVKKRLILVVEDNQSEADLLRLNLEDEGFRVELATNGRQGLEKMATERPDLVTLNLLMPEMDGFSFMEAKAANPEYADIPVAIISANTDDTKVGALGVRSVLRKPIRRQELLALVNSTLGPTGGHGRPTILLIDDEPKAITSISTFFAKEEYEILYCYSGKDGLSLAREKKPDLIFLDLMMPEMNGFEVLARLKEDKVTRDIPVVILTAKILSSEERRQLLDQAVFIADKSQQSSKSIITNIKQLLGPSRQKKHGGNA